MTDYMLVPVDPTPEMIDVAVSHALNVQISGSYNWSAYMRDVYLRMLAAAPTVQGEPVAYAAFAENGNIQIWCSDPIQAETLRQQYGEALQPLYTAPQPADQQPEPDVAELVKALDLALEYWRDRQQRYKNRRPKWVVAAELALDAYRKGAKNEDDQ